MISCGKRHHKDHNHKFKVVKLKEGDKLLVVCKHKKKRKKKHHHH